MRFSTVTALCAAPLALAGTLQAELVQRGAVAAEIQVSQSESISNVNGNSNANDNGNNNGNRGGNNLLGGTFVQASSTEVIIIWANAGNGAATSTVTETKTTTQAAAAQATVAGSKAGAAAAAATHTVVVGGTAGLVYTPDSVNAAVGDMVVFQFETKNHTVTQSAFTTPCEPLAGGMNSGFMPNINNSISPAPEMGVQVTVSTPLWFYCEQTAHCGLGMVFSINPTANKTQAMFQQMAIAQNGTGSTAVIVGGTPATSSAAVAATLATTTAAAAGAVSTATGTGTINANGACGCSCLCGVAAFPNAAVQGVGAFGGFAGAIPMSSLTA